jgi:hypothetical protein
MKITLNLKKEFENDKKRSKSDPEEKADESNILSYTVSGHYMEQFHQSLQCKQLSMESHSPNKTVTTRRENKLSR